MEGELQQGGRHIERCFSHPEREGNFVCCNCGRRVCDACARRTEEGVFCSLDCATQFEGFYGPRKLPLAKRQTPVTRIIAELILLSIVIAVFLISGGPQTLRTAATLLISTLRRIFAGT